MKRFNGDENLDEYEDWDNYEDDDASREEDEHEEVVHQPTQEELRYLNLRERLKERMRKASGTNLSPSNRLSSTSTKNNFGSFFGPSQPVIAQRVIQESKSILENPELAARAFQSSSLRNKSSSSLAAVGSNHRVSSSSAPAVSNPRANCSITKSTIVSQKKSQILKNTRDYSFLLSDDAELPGPKDCTMQNVRHPKSDAQYAKVMPQKTRELQSNNGKRVSDVHEERKQKPLGIHGQARVQTGQERRVHTHTGQERRVHTHPHTGQERLPTQKLAHTGQERVHTQKLAHIGQERRVHTQKLARTGQERRVHTQKLADTGQERRVHTQKLADTGQERRVHTQKLVHSGQERAHTHKLALTGQERRVHTQKLEDTGQERVHAHKLSSVGRPNQMSTSTKKPMYKGNEPSLEKSVPAKILSGPAGKSAIPHIRKPMNTHAQPSFSKRPVVYKTKQQEPIKANIVKKQPVSSSKSQQMNRPQGSSSSGLGNSHMKRKLRRDEQDRFIDDGDDSGPENIRKMIQDIMGYNPNSEKFKERDEFDDRQMEVGFDDVMREEKKSARVAKEEDEEEWRKIQEEEERERRRKAKKRKLSQH